MPNRSYPGSENLPVDAADCQSYYPQSSLCLAYWFLRSSAKRFHGIKGDYPRRDSRAEILALERPHNGRFICLNVPCRPVVQQNKSKDMVFGLVDRNRLAEIIAMRYQASKFNLIIKLATRPGQYLVIYHKLTIGTMKLGAGGNNRRRPAL